MKKLFVIIMIAGFLFVGFVFAQSYEPKTKDNEVESRGKVEVTETTTTVGTRDLTLNWIDYTIGSIQAKMAILQEALDEYTALRAAVEIEANKVILKPAPQ